MSEANKAAMRRIASAFGTGDLSTFDELISPQYVEHSPMPGQAAGPERLKQMSTMMRTAFPGLQVTTEDLIGEWDKVVGRFTARGTHRGEFMGAAPTNKVITMQEIHIGRFTDGKLVEHWGLEDSLGMMQQMGLISETG